MKNKKNGGNIEENNNNDNNNEINEFNNLQCAPSKENKPYTCYKTETLI